MSFWWNASAFDAEDQAHNCEIVAGVLRRFPDVETYFPNRAKAPWHVQARIPSATGEDIVLNFWPHKCKAQRDGCYAVEGEDAITGLIREVIHDAKNAEDFDLIED